MQIETKVIPVEGISAVPGIAHDAERTERVRRREEMRLLNVATGLAVMLICAAWIAIALD